MEMMKCWQYLKRIHTNYIRHRGAVMAAAIAYYTLLSLIPLLSMTAALLGWFLGGSDLAMMRLHRGLHEYLPTGNAILFEALKGANQRSGYLGLIGMAGLMYAASVIFANLEMTLNRIWGIRKTRGWLKQRIAAIGSALLTILLVFCSLAITSVIAWIENVHFTGMPVKSHLSFLWRTMGHISPAILSIFLFAALYRVIPNRRVQWQDALLGGLFSGIAWELAKNLFAFYLVRFAHFHRVYGSLGGLIILLIWIYYSAAILLYGAEIAADRERQRYKKLRYEKGARNELNSANK
jgi:membrane protein